MQMTESFPPVTEDQVVAFEAQIGHSLPVQYRQFLLRYHGGKPSRPLFEITGPDDTDCIRFFYGLATGNLYDLVEMREIYDGRIPESILAIAGDELGNRICISLDDGAIYFWDHEMEFEPDKALTRLSDSFDGFVGSLKEDT